MALASRGVAPLARSSHSLTAVGRFLYAFGGEHAPRVPIDPIVHRFSLDDGLWETVPLGGPGSPCLPSRRAARAARPPGASAPCPSARVAHSAAAVGENIFVFGGREGVDEQRPLGDTWAFDTTACAWRQLACAGGGPPARSYHASASLGSTVYVFGGCGAAGRLNDLWALDTQAGTLKWEQLPSSGAVAGRGGACLAAHGTCLYVAAGFNGAAELSDLHCYNTASRTWSVLEAASATLPARSVAALGVVDDALVLFGGEAEVSAQGHAGAGRFRNDAWTWPLREGSPAGWTAVHAEGDAPAPRGWLAAAAVPGIGLCLHGGNSDSNERLGDLHALQLAA